MVVVEMGLYKDMLSVDIWLVDIFFEAHHVVGTVIASILGVKTFTTLFPGFQQTVVLPGCDDSRVGYSRNLFVTWGPFQKRGGKPHW